MNFTLGHMMQLLTELHQQRIDYTLQHAAGDGAAWETRERVTLTQEPVGPWMARFRETLVSRQGAFQDEKPQEPDWFAWDEDANCIFPTRPLPGHRASW